MRRRRTAPNPPHDAYTIPVSGYRTHITIPPTTEAMAYTSSYNTTGTFCASTSRRIPPPTAVTTDKSAMPKTSIPLVSPTAAPEKANATVPSISKTAHVKDIVHLSALHLQHGSNQADRRSRIKLRQRINNPSYHAAENQEQ